MKIAVCLSGQPRTVNRVWKSLYANLLSRMDCDLFIYTSEPYSVDDEFWHIINPKEYLIESQLPFPELEASIAPNYAHPNILNNYLQQVYGYKKVWELKEESGIKYDAVIRTRPDVEYLHPFTLEFFDLTKLNLVPRIIDYDRNQCSTDIFFVGSEDTMGRLLNIFDWLPHANLQFGDPWTQRLPPENVNVLAGKHCPETILMRYIEDMQIPWQFTNFVFEDMMRVYR